VPEENSLRKIFFGLLFYRRRESLGDPVEHLTLTLDVLKDAADLGTSLAKVMNALVDAIEGGFSEVGETRGRNTLASLAILNERLLNAL
jgi:hypothetical protein